MTQESLGHKLLVLRAERGLTLREAASVTGVGKDTLSDLERGLRAPHAPTIAKIARGYGASVRELLEEPIAAGKAEAPPETGRLPGWATASDLNVLNQEISEVSSGELRRVVIELAKKLRVNRTLEDLRKESRAEGAARAMNLARIHAIAEEFWRREEEPPEILAYRQWQKAMEEPPQEAEQGASGAEQA